MSCIVGSGCARSRSGLWRQALVGGLVALAGALGGARLEAAPEGGPAVDERSAQVLALETLLKEHVAQKAAPALIEDARKATALHKACADAPELRKRLLAVHETTLKTLQEDGHRKTVLEELAATRDPAGGRIVRPYLKQPNVKEADVLLIAAIKAAGELACAETADPLVSIFEKSKHMGAATAALEALGGFREVKSRREKILETVTKSVQKNMPGGRPGPRGGPGGVGDPPPDTGTPNPNGSDPTARWGALAPVLPRALNRLTGRNISTAEQWFMVVRDAQRLGDLFVS